MPFVKLLRFLQQTKEFARVGATYPRHSRPLFFHPDGPVLYVLFRLRKLALYLTD